MYKYVYSIPFNVNMISIEISQNMIQYKYELDKYLTLTSMIYYGVPYNARYVVLEKRRGHRSWATTNT